MTPRTLAVALASLVGLMVPASPVVASTIAYSETFTGSGTFGSLGAFTNATVTLTGVGDTTNVLGTPGNADITLAPGAATVTVSTLSGFATFTDTIIVVTTNPIAPLGEADFIDNTLPFVTIAGTVNTSLFNYDLKTLIGPIVNSQTSVGATGMNYGTSVGDLSLTSITASTETFRAFIPASVPEPASVVMLTTGLAGVGLAVYRTRSRRQAAGA
jgi:hypothetical protein